MSDFTIYQIYFVQDQLLNLDRAFVPYDNSGCSTPDEREFFVFKKAYVENSIPETGHVGYLSWKFGAKTGITGSRFLSFCRENPGYDVYYINPFPLEVCRGTVWEQGEKFHPGMKKLAQTVLDTAGYDIDLDKVPQSLLGTAYCNYWVGNKRFWDAYMNFCLPLYRTIQEKLTEEERTKIFSRADRFTAASFFPYIFERFFSTFIALNPHIKCCPYVFSEEELRQKYGYHYASLINQIQQAEIENPNEREPIKINKSFLKASRRVEILSDLYGFYTRLSNRFPILNRPIVKGFLRRIRILLLQKIA